MSANEIVKQIALIRGKISSGIYDYLREIRTPFLVDVNRLQEIYGTFVGRAKAKHREYTKELSDMDNAISECFQVMLKTSKADACFKLLNLAVKPCQKFLSTNF